MALILDEVPHEGEREIAPCRVALNDNVCGIEPDIRVPQLSDPDAAKRAQFQLRESDLRGHLVNEVNLEDEALEADRADDPRFTLTSAELEKRGIKDFQLDYAIKTLRRTARTVVASRN